MEYKKPLAEVVRFEAEDVIAASGLVDGGNGDFTGGDGNYEW